MSWTARLLEDLRQWVLVGGLGQVTCDGSHEDLVGKCTDCGAAV